MPLIDKKCPNCNGYLHTDDLLEKECVTPGCGAELPDSLYEGINSFYTPKEVNNG